MLPPSNSKKPFNAKKIRHLAEAKHTANSKNPKLFPSQLKFKAMVHELEVHQIELEMQNEELEKAYEQKDALLEQYTHLYDFAPVGYISLDKKAKILKLSLLAAEKLGHHRAGLIAKSFFDYITRGDRASFERFLLTLNITHENASIQVELSSAPITVEIKGLFSSEPEEIRLAMLDITHTKKMEAENQRLVAAIEETADSVVITNREGTIEYVNQAFEKATGYSKAEALGSNPRILKSGKQDEAFYENMWECLASGKPWRGHFINKIKDGSLIEEVASISPIRNHLGQVSHYVAVKHNIMELRALEAQLHQAQKMDAVGRLAGGIAHDFNNLLMALMGYSELSKDQIDPNHPVQENLDEILNIIKRASEITNQLLVFSRKQVLNPSNIDLNERIAFNLKLLERLVGETFTIKWQPGKEPAIASIDPVQLDQVLVNLIINARDSYDKQGVIHLSTGKSCLSQKDVPGQPDVPSGSYIWICVKDLGSGMSEETQAHIFEPFYTTKGVGKGTGLGLATVYGIVNQNGGFIRVSSQLALGSEFKIFFPEASEVAPQQNQPPPVAMIPRGNGERLLVVDDESAIRDILGHSLQSLGYEVKTAASAKEALALQTQQGESDKFVLILTDIMMPEMTGIEMSRQMHAQQPDLKILFMTGHVMGPDVEALELAQPDCFLKKPFKINILAAKLREVLDNKTL